MTPMADLHLNGHISKGFTHDLESLQSRLLAMGGLVENQVVHATQSLIEANMDMANQVLHMEPEVDRRELVIDEECTTIIARRQPAAIDLRLVLAVAKINIDLERIGDEANRIAESARVLSIGDASSPHGLFEIRHIGNNAHQMLHNALEAFARLDVTLAYAVIHGDRTIDRDYATAMREMMSYMMEDPRSITRVIRIIWALRSLERIGDHARNIGEQVIYLVNGKDIRHLHSDEPEPVHRI